MTLKAAGAKVQNPKVSSDERLTLDVPAAGRVLGLSRNAAYEAVRRGDIPAVKIGGRLLVPKAALMRLLETTPAAGVAAQGAENQATAAKEEGVER